MDLDHNTVELGKFSLSYNMALETMISRLRELVIWKFLNKQLAQLI